MNGGTVCSVHGGMSGKVRQAACERELQAAAARLVADAEARFERRYAAWLTRRIATAARVLGRPAEFFLDARGRPIWLLLA
jgi:hypothetical protein